MTTLHHWTMLRWSHRGGRTESAKIVNSNKIIATSTVFGRRSKIRKAVEMENQFNERARMEDCLRIGALPASITHPIAVMMRRAAALVVAAPVVAMEVDEPGAIVARNHDGNTYQTTTRETDRNRGILNLEDYTLDEDRMFRGTPMGPDVLRSLNIKIRARNAQYNVRMARRP